MVKFLLLFLFISVSHAKITTKSTLPWMNNLGQATDCVIANPAFGLEVGSILKFDYSDKNGLQVMGALNASRDVLISTYRTWNPKSKTIAYTVYGSKAIYFNLWNNPRPFPDLINTVIHEVLHLEKFSHGNNSSVGKQNTVNYRVGGIAERYVVGCLL